MVSDKKLTKQKAHLRIGKNGVTKSILDEISRQLSVTDTVIIRLLSNFCDNNDRVKSADMIADKTSSRIKLLRGGTLVLTRRES